MNNIFIFPMGMEIIPLIENKSILPYDNIYILGSTNNNYINNNYDHLIFANSYEQIINACNTALFVYEEQIPLDEYKKAIDILLSVDIKIFVVSTIANILHIQSDLNVTVLDNPELNVNSSVKQVVPIPVPIILILGDGKFSEKFNVQLKLHNIMVSKGYKVLSFTSKEYGEFIGMNRLPKFIFDKMSLTDKIVALNHYLYQIVHNQSPDLMLISAPGGVLPISSQFVEDYGEYSIVISNAAIADIVIRSLYYNQYDEEFFKNDMNSMKYRLNATVEYYNISRTSLVYPPSLMDHLGFVCVDNDNLNRLIDSISHKLSDCLVFDSNNDTQINIIADDILNKLSSDVSII